MKVHELNILNSANLDKNQSFFHLRTQLMNPEITFIDHTPRRLQKVRHGADFLLVFHIFFDFQSKI